VKRNNSGFTLVEVLIAILLTALIMSSVMGVLHDAMNSRDAIHNISQFQRAGPMILDQIETDIRSLAPYNVAGRKCFLGKKNAIRGADADTVDFVVMRGASVENLFTDSILRTERPLETPLCEVGYHLRQNPRETMFMELYRREDPLLDEEPYKGGTYQRIYDKITNFKITYFADPGSQGRSEDTWSCEDKEMLPQRMQIDLELEIEPRVEIKDRPPDARLRRSYRRVINFDADMNRVLLANLRPRLPEPPKADDAAGSDPTKNMAPGGALAGPGGGGKGGAGAGAIMGAGKGGDKNPFGGNAPKSGGIGGSGLGPAGGFPGGGKKP
jgi:prepilin-type N-terminal cleavage/methylation domain-containing protein